MAKAPKPGRAQADEAAKVRLRITVGDRTLELQPAALEIDEKFVVRGATGLPFEAYYSGPTETSSIGEDSVAILWWLARRANGEPRLAFRKAMSEWTFDPDAFEIEEIIDDEDESPEA